MRKLFGALICVAANAVPLVGITHFEWEPALVLLLYWLEFAVVGLVSIPKILWARGQDDPDDLPSMQLDGKSMPRLIGISPYTLVVHFIMRFGVLWALYGAFVLVYVFAIDQAVELAELPIKTLAIGLGAFTVFHLSDYGLNFVAGDQKERTGPLRQFINPFFQLMPLHLALVFGGFIGAIIGGGDGMSTGVVIVLVAVKTFIDLVRTLRDTQEGGTRTEPSSDNNGPR